MAAQDDVSLQTAQSFRDPDREESEPQPTPEAKPQPAPENAPHGIGATMETFEGAIVIRSLYQKFSGYAAGLRTGDFVSHVDGRPVAGMATDDVAALIRGPRGSTVRIGFERRDPLAKTKQSREIVVARTVRLDGKLTWGELLEGLAPRPHAVAPPTVDKARSAKELDEGRKAFDASQIRKAIDRFESALSAWDDNAVVRLRLAEAYVAAGMGEKALGQLARMKDTEASPEQRLEKAALARGIWAEISARDADPTIAQAERVLRQSDRIACAVAMELECLESHGRNDIYATSDIHSKLYKYAALAKLQATSNRRTDAVKTLAEAANLARTVSVRRDYLVKPAQVDASRLLARVANAHRATGDADGARRLADEAIETALSAGPITEAKDGRVAIPADQVRAQAVLEVASELARAGDRDAAERALEKGVALSQSILRRSWNGDGATQYTSCGAANVQAVAYVRPHYVTDAAEAADVLGRNHACRYWTARYAAQGFIGKSKYISALGVLAVYNVPLPYAEGYAAVARKLAEDGFHGEAAVAGARAAAVLQARTDLELGKRTNVEFSPSSLFVDIVQDLARAGLIDESERLAARIPSILRQDESNSYLDAAGLDKRIQDIRSRLSRNQIVGLLRRGSPLDLATARRIFQSLPPASSDRKDAAGDMIGAEIRSGELDSALALLRETGATWRAGDLIAAAAIAGRVDLIETAIKMTSAGMSGATQLAMLSNTLVRSGRWDDARARDPLAGTATSALERQVRDKHYDWAHFNPLSWAESFAELRKTPIRPFEATAANADAALRQGFNLAAANFHHGAVDLYRAGLRAAPNNGAAHFYLAESLFRLGKYEDARGHYEQARTLAAAGDEGRQAAAALADFDARVATHRTTAELSRRRNAQLAASLAAAQKQMASLQGAAAAQARAAAEERRTAQSNKEIREWALKSLAVNSLHWLGFYDGGKYSEAALAKGELPDHTKSPVFRQALGAWQKRRGMSDTGELSVDVAERIEGESHKLLTWGAACFRQPPSNLDSAKRGDPIMRSLVMAQAFIAMRGCQQGERLNASSCQVCAAPPPELGLRPGGTPMFVEK